MPSFYSGGSVSGSGGGKTVAPVSPTFDFPSSESKPKPQDDTGGGKGSIDLTDPLGSIGNTVGSLIEFGSGLVGGAAGLVGSIGVPGGPNLGDIGELPGGAVDALGSIGGGAVGAIPGVAADIVSAPGRFIEGEAAKSRLRNAQGTGTFLDQFISNIGGSFSPFGGGQVEGTMRQALEAAIAQGYQPSPDEQKFLAKFAIPEDIQARLDAGESIDTLAEEMVNQGRGFSNDPLQNITSGIVFDPMNLIAPGVGKAATAAKTASRAIAAGESIGVGGRFMGTAYGAASRGLSAGGAKLVDSMLGRTTSGVFHAIGVKPYLKIRNAAARLAPEYGQAYEKYEAIGAAQLPMAVIAKDMADELGAAVAAHGDEGYNALRPTLNVEARLRAERLIPGSRIERDAEELLARVTPDFAGHTDEGRFLETRDKLAEITGMSPEDAARSLGGKASLQEAQHVHLAFYGKAGDDLNIAKAADAAAKNIDAGRVTILAPDTLTVELADEILKGDANALISAVDNYSVLRNRFAGTQFEHTKVLDYIRKLRDEGALARAVRAPVTGKDALPPALKAWSMKYEKFGYKLGFEPEDGMKVLLDEEGKVIDAAPWVPFVSEAAPLNVRNPLGRFVESMFRGTSQTTIILDSRNRFTRLTRGTGLSANQARAIHRDILQTAAERRVSPRGLAGTHGEVLTILDDKGRSVSVHGNAFDAVFARHLTTEEYTAFRQKHNATYMVMRAFEGNLGRVGLTQKFTGLVKSAEAGAFGTEMIPKITEYLYPKLRFEMSALFQVQEKIESPFLNALRGVRPVNLDEGVADFYRELTNLPDFKFLTEAGYVLNISGGDMAARMLSRRGRLGQALARFTDVKSGKDAQRIAQVFSEHPEEFENAVNAINPRLWRTMTEAYGTTDAREVARLYMTERQALASGKLSEAMAVFDNAKPSDIQRAYDAGDTAAGQALNRAVGAQRGANGAGGAMKLTDAEVEKLRLLDTADAETVWQAFRESFRQSSMQAFKTHYFSPERGFLERTINHPYLGLYPASYMWGKVLPEFARFLLKRPFGLNAPLVGYAAMTRVQEEMGAWIATDPEFAKALEGNKDFIYLINVLMPGDPTNLVANAPAWARHLSQQQRAGGVRDPQRFAEKEFQDSFSYAIGPIRSFNVASKAVGDLGDVAGDIFSNLDRAAKSYDALVLPR